MISALILAGPTASGKTSLSLAIAKNYPVEIVSTDSLQLFRYLDIGTAKPTRSELEQVPHHMIDRLNPDEAASAAWYASEALKAVSDIQERKKIPLIVGGSGFYLRALERPPRSAVEETPPLTQPLSEAYAELERKDPAAAQKIHPNDHYRVTRAHALLQKGKLPSEEWSASREQSPTLKTLWIGLACDRTTLYERIDKRLETMFAQGLIEETEQVLRRFPNSKSKLARAIGYRQALDVIEKKTTLPLAIKEAKEKSHQYAKRQMTWFRSEKRIEWLSENEVLSRFGYYLEQLG